MKASTLYAIALCLFIVWLFLGILVDLGADVTLFNR